MGYTFSLILDRVITEDEKTVLKEKNKDGVTFGSDTLPTDANVEVSRLEFDDAESDKLAEAIEFALEAVKEIPELSVPGLTVPPQPATREQAAEQAELVSEK